MYEYKVVPAPESATKSLRFWKSQGDFTDTVADTMNELALEHWEYLRADKLPVRKGRIFKGRAKNRDMLVFRREVMRVQAGVPAAKADRPERPVGKVQPRKVQVKKPVLPSAVAAE